MTWDDPQIHTIKEFLTDERDAIIDLLTELNKKAEIELDRSARQLLRRLHVMHNNEV